MRLKGHWGYSPPEVNEILGTGGGEGSYSAGDGPCEGIVSPEGGLDLLNLVKSRPVRVPIPSPRPPKRRAWRSLGCDGPRDVMTFTVSSYLYAPNSALSFCTTATTSYICRIMTDSVIHCRRARSISIHQFVLREQSDGSSQSRRSARIESAARWFKSARVAPRVRSQEISRPHPRRYPDRSHRASQCRSRLRNSGTTRADQETDRGS